MTMLYLAPTVSASVRLSPSHSQAPRPASRHGQHTADTFIKTQPTTALRFGSTNDRDYRLIQDAYGLNAPGIDFEAVNLQNTFSQHVPSNGILEAFKRLDSQESSVVFIIGDKAIIEDAAKQIKTGRDNLVDYNIESRQKNGQEVVRVEKTAVHNDLSNRIKEVFPRATAETCLQDNPADNMFFMGMARKLLKERPDGHEIYILSTPQRAKIALEDAEILNGLVSRSSDKRIAVAIKQLGADAVVRYRKVPDTDL